MLRANQLYTKQLKCQFECITIDYLRHVISENGITMDLRKLQAIRDWSLPKIPKALRGFLGFTSYYRKFVRGYGGIAAPLNRMHKILMDNLTKAWDRMKVFADKHRTERAFKVGDVLLKLQPYCQSTARGAMPRKLSP